MQWPHRIRRGDDGTSNNNKHQRFSPGGWSSLFCRTPTHQSPQDSGRDRRRSGSASLYPPVADLPQTNNTPCCCGARGWLRWLLRGAGRSKSRTSILRWQQTDERGGTVVSCDDTARALHTLYGTARLGTLEGGRAASFT